MYFTYTAGQNYTRTLTQGVTLTDSKACSWNFKRAITQAVKTDSGINVFKTITRLIQELAHGLDSLSFPAHFYRAFKEYISVTETIGTADGFLRGLFDKAGVGSEISFERSIFRKMEETVQAAGAVFRGLLLFVSIVTGTYVRDYLLNRFLKAKTELIIKSCISRELILDSKIN
jgi:hypothetical protein